MICSNKCSEDANLFKEVTLMRDLYMEDRQYILNVYSRMNLELVSGEGSYLLDREGNQYLDMFSGLSVNNLGHNNPEIVSIIADQAAKYLHLSNYFPSEPTVNLAKLLVENTFASKVFFVNSGTEANEAALKLARKYGKKFAEDKVQVLSAFNSFHGRTYGGLTLTGQEKFHRDFRPLIPEVVHFRFNDLEDFQTKVSEKTCAVFLEIVQGEGGVREVSAEFLQTLARLSREYNFLIIFDEIQTGIGRVGDFFAFEKFDIQPDVVTLAKSLGGGIPLGAMLVSEEVEGVLTPGDHGSTFGGNPLACAVGKYVVETVMNVDFQWELKKKSELLFTGLYRLRDKFPHLIGEIRGRGLMIGIEMGEYASRVKELALRKNILLNVTSQTVVRLLPALNISIETLQEFLGVFAEILIEVNV